MITSADLACHQSEIFERLLRRHADLSRYAYTIRSLRSLNVAENSEYQRTFNGLYMVRRNAFWRTKFYEVMEKLKVQSEPNFEAVLTELWEATGRAEASFASKLIATINPSLPVYDSIVRLHLGIPQRSASDRHRMALLSSDYAKIQAHSFEETRNPKFRVLREMFNTAFPEFKDFSDTKVLDLMIWQMR